MSLEALPVPGCLQNPQLTQRNFLFLPSQLAAGINSALDSYFPEGCGVDVVARPGRYYVTSAFTLAVSITALEELPSEQPGSDGGCDSRECPPCPRAALTLSLLPCRGRGWQQEEPGVPAQ